MLHKTALERYAKLKRVFSRLMEKFTLDDLDDFIQTANSLREWIEQDTSLLPEQRDHLKRFTVPQSLDWQICNQVANAQKHVRKANPRSRKRQGGAFIPVITVAEIKSGAGAGFIVPPSRRVIGAGDEIVLSVDGNRENALGFVIRTFKHFHYIFEMAPIPLGQRVIPTDKELFGIRG